VLSTIHSRFDCMIFVTVCCRLLEVLLDTQKSYNDLLHSYIASTRSHSKHLRFGVLQTY